MAKNTIAKASVLVSANADGVNPVLTKAGKDVESWSNKAGKKSGSSFANMFSGGVKAAGPLLAVGAGLVGFQALTNTAGDLLDTISDISKMGNIATAMGLTPEAFTGIAGIARTTGEDTREFLESMVTLGKLGTDAARGTEQAAEAFKTLGLNADEFNKLKADEQFYTIFEAINKVESPLGRVRLLMQAFGEDGGKYLIPLLSKAPEELRKMGKEFALTGEQIKKAQDAQTAVLKIRQTFDKGFKSIAAFVAPFVEKVAKGIGSIIDFVKPVFDWMERGWNKAVEVGTHFWNAIEAAGQGVIDWFKENMSGMFDWVKDLPTIEEMVVMTFRAIGTSAALAWDTIKFGAGVVSMAAGNIITAFSKVVEVFKEVVSLALELPEALRPKGLDDFIRGVEAFDSTVATTGKTMTDWGAKAITSWGDSAEQFNKWLDKSLATTKKMKQEGAPILPTGETPKADKMKLAEALLPASREAYSLVVRNQYRDMMGTKDKNEKEIKDATKGTKKNTDAIKGDMKKMADKLDLIGTV